MSTSLDWPLTVRLKTRWRSIVRRSCRIFDALTDFVELTHIVGVERLLGFYVEFIRNERKMVVETVPFGTQVYQIHVADSLRKEKRRKGPPGNWEETGLDGIVDRMSEAFRIT